MTQFAEEERFPVFPVFLLIDVSGSMAGEAMNAVNLALPQLKQAIASDPASGEIARIGIVTFSDGARVVLPLSDLLHVQMPALRAGGLTNFAAAFRMIRMEIEGGIRSLGRGTRFHKPVVFFVSDGQDVAGENWPQALRELTDREFKFAPEIVTFGFGGADPQVLGQISTRYAFMAKDTDPAAAVREIISTLIASIKTTSGSLAGAGHQSGLLVQPNPDQFTALPVQTV
jgi:uncharacterized protein YegL